MLKEGYEKVCITLILIFPTRAEAGAISDQTGSIQDCHFQAMDSGPFGY
jgi:hypothetical protein